MVQLGSRVESGELEIPSASLRAGSSLRLKSGCAQDDNRRLIVILHHDGYSLPRGLRSGLRKKYRSILVKYLESVSYDARANLNLAKILKARNLPAKYSIRGSCCIAIGIFKELGR
jgi:hypothetical protein